MEGKMKFLCSFGGSFLPRPKDGKLRYAGGDTRIVVVQRNVKYSDLVSKLREVCDLKKGISVQLKYQRPNGDLNSLVSLSSDEDVRRMTEEYDFHEALTEGTQAARIRLFVLTSDENIHGNQNMSKDHNKNVQISPNLPANNGKGPEQSKGKRNSEPNIRNALPLPHVKIMANHSSSTPCSPATLQQNPERFIPPQYSPAHNRLHRGETKETQNPERFMPPQCSPAHNRLHLGETKETQMRMIGISQQYDAFYADDCCSEPSKVETNTYYPQQFHPMNNHLNQHPVLFDVNDPLDFHSTCPKEAFICDDFHHKYLSPSHPAEHESTVHQFSGNEVLSNKNNAGVLRNKQNGFDPPHIEQSNNFGQQNLSNSSSGHSHHPHRLALHSREPPHVVQIELPKSHSDAQTFPYPQADISGDQKTGKLQQQIRYPPSMHQSNVSKFSGSHPYGLPYTAPGLNTVDHSGEFHVQGQFQHSHGDSPGFSKFQQFDPFMVPYESSVPTEVRGSDRLQLKGYSSNSNPWPEIEPSLYAKPAVRKDVPLKEGSEILGGRNSISEAELPSKLKGESGENQQNDDVHANSQKSTSSDNSKIQVYSEITAMAVDELPQKGQFGSGKNVDKGVLIDKNHKENVANVFLPELASSDIQWEQQLTLPNRVGRAAYLPQQHVPSVNRPFTTSSSTGSQEDPGTVLNGHLHVKEPGEDASMYLLSRQPEQQIWNDHDLKHGGSTGYHDSSLEYAYNFASSHPGNFHVSSSPPEAGFDIIENGQFLQRPWAYGSDDSHLNYIYQPGNVNMPVLDIHPACSNSMAVSGHVMPHKHPAAQLDHIFQENDHSRLEKTLEGISVLQKPVSDDIWSQGQFSDFPASDFYQNHVLGYANSYSSDRSDIHSDYKMEVTDHGHTPDRMSDRVDFLKSLDIADRSKFQGKGSSYAEKGETFDLLTSTYKDESQTGLSRGIDASYRLKAGSDHVQCDQDEGRSIKASSTDEQPKCSSYQEGRVVMPAMNKRNSDQSRQKSEHVAELEITDFEVAAKYSEYEIPEVAAIDSKIQNLRLNRQDNPSKSDCMIDKLDVCSAQLSTSASSSLKDPSNMFSLAFSTYHTNDDNDNARNKLQEERDLEVVKDSSGIAFSLNKDNLEAASMDGNTSSNEAIQSHPVVMTRNIAIEAEEQALAKGLQTIKNADLEEIRELGSGTYGTVYHGKWKGSDVAIKRIKASCFEGSYYERERLIADFWKEASILSELHHPNVVSFYGVVRDGPNNTLATVTEYMVNGSLKQVLRKKERLIDRRKRFFLAMDAAFGMEYLHEKNIVHFDLKCENLLVNMRDTQRPVCKIGDLGLSKIKHQTLVSGGVRGTLPWMAPELLSGKTGMVTEKVDIYSFAIVMWELLTGEEPYANMHCGSIIGGIMNNTLRPTVPTWCDPAWRSLMERCWSNNPEERPNFSEISKELRAVAASHKWC
eukprot:TRINITY_DN542_c0_g1_i6.p1 TRINITY_DN542_c0_g1~~TRINITY_DN542_c0_g1_i6.p1  ORF type:complete len:1450 (+),score=256.59 TRINITY_DN542_c0_g1_i6:254-4603(+)